MITRRIHVSPRRDVFASIEGDLVLRSESEDLTRVRFSGHRSAPSSGLERLTGPLTARLVVTRFLDETLDRLDEAATIGSDVGSVEHPDDRPGHS